MTFPTNDGVLAHFDSVECGMVPCKVLGRNKDGYLEIRFTATRGAWHKGMTFCSTDTWVIPRGYAKRNKYGWTIFNGFSWE